MFITNSSDGTRESSIVTKMFLVEEAVNEHQQNYDEMSEEMQGKHEVCNPISSIYTPRVRTHAQKN